jgi:hypothetical protein
MSQDQALQAFYENGKVAAWLKHYPEGSVGSRVLFDEGSRSWRVYVGNEAAGVVADGQVSDDSGLVTEAWTGPQVYWTMARGRPGFFGGRTITSWPVWLAFCLVFLLGLLDVRRLLSWRNLDLIVLLSFSLSLVFFNRGDIFTSIPLAYPPLLYLIGRCGWIGWTGRSEAAGRPLWPVWALVVATVALAGLRIGLDAGTANVIDVGYSGVIGAQRIAAGEVPYGTFPVSNGRICGPEDSHGNRRGRLQGTGRCEVPQAAGDTYGPVVYESALPGYALFGWKGQWGDLPAARFTAIVFDAICLGLLALLGWRIAGARLAATLAFAWAAFPFTLYAMASNTNDMIPPAFLLAGLVLVAVPWARGASVALSAWAKFASLLLVPLWASYPDGRSKPRDKGSFALGFLVATLVAFSILLLDGHPLHATSVFWDRTIGHQLGRESPFSLWDWRQFHASGIPNLHPLQLTLEVLVVVAAIAAYFVPRRKSLLQLVALTGLLLLGFELVMTHWHYLYIPWFFPFVALASLWPGGRTKRTSAREDAERADEPGRAVTRGIGCDRDEVVGAGP